MTIRFDKRFPIPLVLLGLMALSSCGDNEAGDGSTDTAKEEVKSRGQTIDVQCPAQSLQSAVDSAQTNDVLRVSGICREQIRVIGKKLSIVGVDGTNATIEAPESGGYDSGTAYFGRNSIIYIFHSTVTLDNLMVDGRSTATASGLIGVFFRSSSSTLRQPKIQNIIEGGLWNTSAIRVTNSSDGADSAFPARLETVTMNGNFIHDFESNGIFTTTHTNVTEEFPLTLKITNNHISGDGTRISLEAAQNGMQLGGFSPRTGYRFSLMSATTQDNLNENLWFQDIFNTTSSGVLLPEGVNAYLGSGPAANHGKVTVSRNMVFATQSGLFMFGTLVSTQFVNNRVDTFEVDPSSCGCTQGIRIYGTTVGKATGSDLRNLLYGIEIDTKDAASRTQALITTNRFTHVVTPVGPLTDLAAKVQGNKSA